jgi:MFS family permease
MTPTILVLLGGLGLLLVGVGLLGTLLGVRAAQESFGNLETGLIMAGYYGGYVAGTILAPRVVRNVGHIRSFATFAAVGSASSLSFGLFVAPWFWFLLRVINGLCVVGIYMVVESWINDQSRGPHRGRVFSLYMMSTLMALGAGQFLLLAGDISGMTLFAIAAILISLGVVPIAVTRVTEPQISPMLPVRLGELFRISPLGSAGVLGAGMVNGVFWGMMPVFGQKMNLAAGEIAWLMSVTILGGAILQWPIGHLSDRVDRRKVLVVTSGLTAMVAAASALLVIEQWRGLAAVSFFYGGLMFSLYGISVAHTNDHLEPAQVLEATRGLILLYGVGAFCGPLLGGLSMEITGPAGLPASAATVSAILAGFGIFRMTQRSSPPLEEQGEFVPMVRTSPVALEMYPEADLSKGPESGNAG